LRVGFQQGFTARHTGVQVETHTYALSVSWCARKKMNAMKNSNNKINKIITNKIINK
jgi:hypothetical protein